MADIENYYAPKSFARFRSVALGVGGLALIAWAVGTYFDPEQGLRSWLLGFIFWGGLSIGSLGVLMLQYVTGGAWGVVIRRTVEAGSRTLILAALTFIPIAVGVFYKLIYEWTHLPADDPAMVQRGSFLTPNFWIIRSVIYFAIFGFLAYMLNRWSSMQDKTDNIFDAERLLEKASRFSGPSLVVYCLVVTVAVVDWVMSLDPHWYSTIWGLLFVAGWALSCFSFSVIVLAYLSDKAPMDHVLGKRHFHDIGKLMLALTMVWAYFNFSQFLIIWSGNIPEETSWFLTRMKGGWGYMGVALIVFHFAFPFLVLLQQDFKRRAKWISLLAVFMLIMRLVDMLYQIAPSPRVTPGIENGAFVISWLDAIGPIAIGGIWLWWFFGELMKRPLVPVKDPLFENAIKHGAGH